MAIGAPAKWIGDSIILIRIGNTCASQTNLIQRHGIFSHRHRTS